MTDLLALAAQIEAADGPSRELDAQIAVAIRYFPVGVGFVWKHDLTPNSPEIGRVECLTKFGTGGPHYKAPTFTASIDEALTLVPEGLVWNVMTDFGLPGRARLWGEIPAGAVPDRGVSADGNTPALALCAAALKARAGAS